MKKIPLILTAVIMTMLSFGCSEEWMMALNGTRVISDDSESQSGSRWSLCKEGSYEEVEYPADTFTAINADSYYISFGSDKVNYNGTEYSFRKTDNRYDLWSKSDGSSSLSIYATFYVTKQTDTTLITYWPALSKYRAYLKTKVCTVTYNANGGKITQKTQSVAVTGSSVRVTLVSAYRLGLSRTDYIFKGWATSSTGSVKYTDMDSVTVSSNITLYAVWTVFRPSTTSTTTTTIGGGQPSMPSILVTGNIRIGNVEYDKTSFVKVMYTAVTVIGSDDNWSGYLDSSAPDYYKGAFIAGRTVKLSPYYMAQYQVTQQLYEAVMNSGTNYDRGQGDTHPAYYVSWYDAITFCNKLSLLMDKEPCYTVSGITDWAGLAYSSIPTSNNSVWNEAVCDITKNGYRLPTEAEWEFAARGGDPSKPDWKYAFSGIQSLKQVYRGTTESDTDYNGTNKYLYTDTNLSTVGWYWNNSSSSTHPVGEKAANRLRLYDMSGNLYELCWDWHGTVTSNDTAWTVGDVVKNPMGAASGFYRVLRGGSWNYSAYNCCVSDRNYGNPSNRGYDVGFRPVCSAE